MCAWQPRTTALGGLSNICFIVRKPEPLCKIFQCLLYLIIIILGPIKLNSYYILIFNYYRN
jgi:hypothetical protein